MQVKAIAKNIRVSPFKVRLVVNQIKKMNPTDAVKMLDFINKAASKPVKKVVLSAIANAKNNNNLDETSLKFSEIQVGHGRAFKRYRPIARGRAHSILKRTSNIKVVLEGEQKKKPATVKSTETKSVKLESTKGRLHGSKS